MENYLLVKSVDIAVDDAETELVWLVWLVHDRLVGQLLDLAIELHPFCNHHRIAAVTFKEENHQIRCVDHLHDISVLGRRTAQLLSEPSGSYWESLDIHLRSVGRNLVLAHGEVVDMELSSAATAKHSDGYEVLAGPLRFIASPDFYECIFSVGLLHQVDGSQLQMSVRELLLLLRFLLARRARQTEG